MPTIARKPKILAKGANESTPKSGPVIAKQHFAPKPDPIGRPIVNGVIPIINGKLGPKAFEPKIPKLVSEKAAKNIPPGVNKGNIKRIQSEQKAIAARHAENRKPTINVSVKQTGLSIAKSPRRNPTAPSGIRGVAGPVKIGIKPAEPYRLQVTSNSVNKPINLFPTIEQKVSTISKFIPVAADKTATNVPAKSVMEAQNIGNDFANEGGDDKPNSGIIVAAVAAIAILFVMRGA